LQRQRIEQLRLEFCEEQTTLVSEFETERSLICAQHHQEMHELQDIMYAMDQSYEDRDADARIEFQSQRDELKNKVTTSMPRLFCHQQLSALGVQGGPKSQMKI